MEIVKPNNEQKKQLAEMLFCGLVDIRTAARQGDTEHVIFLADIFHNLPHYLFDTDIDTDGLAFFRDKLEDYVQEYGEFKGYLDCFDKIMGKCGTLSRFDILKMT